jgi:hypothetical protein
MEIQHIQIRVYEQDGDLKKRAEAAAKSARMSLSGWCRWVISYASDQQLSQAKRKEQAK